MKQQSGYPDVLIKDYYKVAIIFLDVSYTCLFTFREVLLLQFAPYLF